MAPQRSGLGVSISDLYCKLAYNSCLPPTQGGGATPELTEPLVTKHVRGGAAAAVPEWLGGGRAARIGREEAGLGC